MIKYMFIFCMISLFSCIEAPKCTSGMANHEYGQWEKTESSRRLEKKCKHCGWLEKKDYR